jgi:hypothetical protein
MPCESAVLIPAVELYRARLRALHAAADRHRHRLAVSDDTCGNLIQLIEETPDENHDDAR